MFSLSNRPTHMVGFRFSEIFTIFCACRHSKKKTIIEQSWLDTLLLDLIERSLEGNDDALHFAPDFVISR